MKRNYFKTIMYKKHWCAEIARVKSNFSRRGNGVHLKNKTRRVRKEKTSDTERERPSDNWFLNTSTQFSSRSRLINTKKYVYKDIGID